MSIEIERLDAVGQAELVREGRASPRELVDAAIERIEARQPEIGALAGRDFEAARARASAELAGPLAGVPFLVKDLIPYPGLRYSLGCRLFAGGIPAEASAYSRALDRAGLVVLGKTTTSELGLLGSTETALEGTTHNPWDPGVSAGGSSGGSSAAVASGMVPMAHASDGGGSIRIPAAMNGLFGFKPGRRRVVSAGVEDMDGLVVDHCVSWSVRDSALLLSLTEEPGGGDEAGAIGFADGPAAARLRIGYYWHTAMGDEPAATVRTAFEECVGLCRELGHELVEVSAPPADGREVSDAFFTMAGAGIDQLANMVQPMLGRAPGGDELEPFTLELLSWFRGLSAATIEQAHIGRERASARMRELLSDYDALLCPTIPDEPHRLGWLAPDLGRELVLERTERLAGYTAIHNIAGVPGMSVPLAHSPAGLPIGMHFAAARGCEGRLLALAYELESARPWKDRLPFMTRP